MCFYKFFIERERERERVCVCVSGPSTNGTEAEHGKTTICLPEP